MFLLPLLIFKSNMYRGSHKKLSFGRRFYTYFLEKVQKNTPTWTETPLRVNHWQILSYLNQDSIAEVKE